MFYAIQAELLPEGPVRIITTNSTLDQCGVAFRPSGRSAILGEALYTPLQGHRCMW